MLTTILCVIIFVALIGIVFYWNLRLPQERSGDFKRYVISMVVSIVAFGLIFQFVLEPARNDNPHNPVSDREKQQEQIDDIAKIAEQQRRAAAAQAAADAAAAQAAANRAAAENEAGE